MTCPHEEPLLNVVEMPPMTLLPPAPDRCRFCAVQHAPDEPHDAQSLFYMMRFRMAHGRDGTWADALAHCTPEVQRMWRRGIEEFHRWSEPPPGVPAIAEQP